MKKVKWSVGKAIRDARHDEQGITQKQLAELLTEASDGETWSQYKVSRIESGEQQPTWDEVVLIARVQGMPLDWYQTGYSALLADPGEHKLVVDLRDRARNLRRSPLVGFA